MSKVRNKAGHSRGAEPKTSSPDFPATPAERERSQPAFIEEVAAGEKGPAPGEAQSPYGGGTFNGTTDSSRFSTPPPKKS